MPGCLCRPGFLWSARSLWSAAAALLLWAWAGPAEASLKGDLKKALERRKPRLERCYDRELKRDDPATGTVLIAVAFGKDGRASKVSVARASKKQKAVGSCIARKLRRLRVAPQPEDVTVVVPIRLRPLQS